MYNQWTMSNQSQSHPLLAPPPRLPQVKYIVFFLTWGIDSLARSFFLYEITKLKKEESKAFNFN